MLIALLIILAYLIGSIPSGLIVGKLARELIFGSTEAAT